MANNPLYTAFYLSQYPNTSGMNGLQTLFEPNNSVLNPTAFVNKSSGGANITSRSACTKREAISEDDYDVPKKKKKKSQSSSSYSGPEPYGENHNLMPGSGDKVGIFKKL